MNPQDQQPKPEPPKDAPATTGTPVAEPPKNLQFTEAPTANAPVLKTAEAERNVKEAENKDAAPMAEQEAIKTKPPKTDKASGPKPPILVMAVAILLFVALAIVAYFAYTKSR